MVKRLKYKYDYYPQFIAKSFNRILAISGTHGKTTTTKLAAQFSNMSYLAGDGSGAYKNTPYFILEACEYQNHFLAYHPYISVILNVDYDHVDFFKTKEEYQKAFYTFAHQSDYIICNIDDPFLDSLNHPHKFTFSLYKDAFLKGSIVEEENGYLLTLKYNEIVKEVHLPIKAIHFVYDYMASFLLLYLIGIDENKMIRKIDSYKLPNRRLFYQKKYGIDCYLDYAHHPTEIKAVFDFISHTYKNRKKIAIYEGHTISRSIYFLKEYKQALDQFDDVYLLPIYTSNREEGNIELENKYFSYLGYKKFQMFDFDSLDENTVVVFMGAGNIDQIFNKM